MSPAHHGRFVSYLRVSTSKQGADGYGVGAQREAVKQRLDGGGWELIKEFVEVESGRKKARPELQKALAYAKAHKAKLVCARLDRLTRNTRFLLELIDSHVDVLFCDFPHIPPGPIGKLILTTLVAVADFEAGMTSERTKAGLAIAKSRGKQIGGRNAQSDRNQAEASERADRLRPVLLEIISEHGAKLTTIADELNRRKITTHREGHWHPMTVARVLQRLGIKGPELVLAVRPD
jgi:DNA invertase Pin-like site-specific DNA recombinase